MTLYTSTCEWCGKSFRDKHKNRRFCCHEHYAQSLKKDHSKVEKRRSCELCGKEFVVKLRKNGSYSSAKYCSEECAIKGGQIKQKETVMREYGVEYAAQSEIIKEKIRKTNLERYGVENTFAVEEFKEKIKQTNLKKFGTEYALGAKEIREKIADTCIKKYGKPYVVLTDEQQAERTRKWHEKDEQRVKKTKETNIKKYDAEFFMQSQAYKDKIQEKFGADHISRSQYIAEKQPEMIKKRRETTFRRYGAYNAMNVPELREKHKETCAEKYSSEQVLSDPVIREKIMKTNETKYGNKWAIASKEIREKACETIMERFGVPYYFQSQESLKRREEMYATGEFQRKVVETKRKNGTFNTSKPEKDILVLLQEKFPDVVYQYRSELYPFDCDFYIPSLNLYVEFQGHWTHGSKPFEGTEEDLAELDKWKQKALTSKFYRNAIDVWTELDVKKRQLARKNELNWIEFFNMDQFNEWYNTFNQRREN